MVVVGISNNWAKYKEIMRYERFLDSQLKERGANPYPVVTSHLNTRSGVKGSSEFNQKKGERETKAVCVSSDTKIKNRRERIYKL